jgi:alanyl-tRNA synthetase
VKITKYRRVESAKDGEIFQLVFNATPFYGETEDKREIKDI